MHKVCILVGSAAISGGTYVIAQHASALAHQGYAVTLAIQDPFTCNTLKWHDELERLRCIPFTEATKETFDLVIATWWRTALEILSIKASHYAYFVQSIESRFYPPEEKPLRALVDATYTLPVDYVTEASWIQNELTTLYNHTPSLVKNGIRKDVYTTQGFAISSDRPLGLRVLVEGHFGVPFKNTALAIRLAKEAGIQDIWLLTGSQLRWTPFVKKIFSRVPMVETGPIYRSCDLLLKLSTVEGMFGPPLEMFHCGGTAVVFDVSGHDEYIIDGYNARVAKKGDCDAVVGILRHLQQSSKALENLRAGALNTAGTWPTWQSSSRQFCEWAASCLKGPPTDTNQCLEIISAAWASYGVAEKERLANNPSISRRYKRDALLAALPRTINNALAQYKAVHELLLWKRKAH
jgi:hypothetical protein